MKDYFILIVDDCPNSRTLLLNSLSHFDKNFILAKNPESAIDILNRLDNIFAAVVDLHYDNSSLTGLDVLKKCSEKQIQSILVTGDFIEDIGELGEIQSKSVKILEKPVNFDLFKSAISDIIKSINE
ncbi:MAG TPA: hypothetical protein PKY81_12325 [bacterium]|nr:hypothetical protein [bacterium]HPN31732.1 hypothetical protein [bacterium]